MLNLARIHYLLNLLIVVCGMVDIARIHFVHFRVWLKKPMYLGKETPGHIYPTPSGALFLIRSAITINSAFLLRLPISSIFVV